MRLLARLAAFIRVRSDPIFLVPIGFVASVLLFYPFRYVLEFDPDEGNTLILARLVTSGSRLYAEGWNDAPPLFYYMLAGVLEVFGMKVTVARLFVLALSCILLFLVVAYLQAFWGRSHAVAGACLIVLLPHFTRLSVSVMIGLPSLVFAVGSFACLAFWHRKRSAHLLVFSALLLAASGMTKLQTVFLAPIFFLGILVSSIRPDPASGRSGSLMPALTWLLWVLGSGFLGGILLIGAKGLPHLLVSHLAAMQSATIQDWAGSGTIAQSMAGSWPILVLSGIGAFFAIRSKSFTGAYLVAWLVVGYLLLTQLRPTWYHHQLLLTIPAAILGGIALGEALRALHLGIARALEDRKGVILSAGALAVLILFLLTRLPAFLGEFSLSLPNLRAPTSPPNPREAMLGLISKYANDTRVLVTDRPMFAFRTGLAVPLELAIFSGKTFLTGMTTEEDFVTAIDRTNPEQVALTRFPMPTVVAHLKEDYELRYSYQNNRLFVRRDILGP